MPKENLEQTDFTEFRTATEQYEETQASLVGLSTVIKKVNFTWKPRVYWRRNQDAYDFVRSNPSAYRNVHITNKIATELNGSYESKIGIMVLVSKWLNI